MNLLESQVSELLVLVKQGVLLVGEQVPPLITEIFKYYIVANWMGLGIGVLLLLITIYLGYLVKKHLTDTCSGIEIIIFGTVSVATLMIGLTVTLCTTFELLKLYLAPRVWLLLYLKQLLSNG